MKLYAVHINKTSRGRTARFAVYRILEDGTADPLWGDVDTAARRLPLMIYSSAGELPAFHFKVDHGANLFMDRVKDRLATLAYALAEHFGEPVELQLLDGWRAQTAHSVDVTPEHVGA